jgi:hypothetical protein
MTVIAMSGKELDRMQVLQDLCTKRITASEAAGLMRLTRRQVFRLARRYRVEGGAKSGHLAATDQGPQTLILG